MKISIRRKLFVLAIIILAINGILGYAVYRSNQKLLDSEQWVQHTEQVIIQSANIRSLGKEMQITSRDFLITDDSAFLEPLNADQKTALVYIGQLKQLTRDNPLQQKRIDSLNFYMSKLFDFSFKTIKSKNKQGFAAVIAYTVDKRRKDYIDRIRQITNAIQQHESSMLKLRKQVNRRNEKEFSRFSVALFVLMSVFTILLLIVVGKNLFQNIEKRKQAAELFIVNKELLLQNDEKEKRTAELTIANKELVFQNNEKEKRAAELKLAEIERIKLVHELLQRNRELEQFAHIVSHNLRAPVANIIGASTALNEMGLTAAEKVTLRNGISASAIKVDDVIHDLNHILQVKSKINEAKEIVNFSELVDDIKASIAHLADKNDVEIKYDFPDINEYFTIRPYLYSIFLNLISNSVKYRQPGNHCVIEIMSHLLKDKIELIFSDNGMGIDLDKKGGQVFGLYKRFHTNIEGKGIGLFMVKTQVEALGGKISLKSKEHVGTEFKIEFEI
jgi:signal transduction histidine kinase